MRRCKNCHKSISNKSPIDFCDERCERKYSPIDLSSIEVKAAFKLVADTICFIFTQHHLHEKRDIEINRKFLASTVVAIWCDCSDNFEQGRLIKYYEKLISTSAENLRQRRELHKQRALDGDANRQNSAVNTNSFKSVTFMLGDSSEAVS